MSKRLEAEEALPLSVPFSLPECGQYINTDIGVSQLRENKKLWQFYGS